MHRLLIASCLAAGLVNRADARPSYAAMEAPLAKDAETIKLYCGNPELAIVVDWPAFEKLDYQVLIGGEEGGDPTVPNRAADPGYVAAARKWILTGVRDRGGLPGSPIGGRGGIIVETFQQLCRDHAEMRGPASRIKKIVLEPINDMKFESDKDAIAFARRTNDWSGVYNAMYETMKDDAESHRAYYLRWVLKGSTLTVTFNVMSRAGVADDYVKIMQGVLDNAGDGGGDEPPAPPERHRAPPPAPPAPPAPPPPPPSHSDGGSGWGPALNCDSGKYAGLPWHSDDDEYPRGALVYQQWVYPQKFVEVYRCTDVEACRRGAGFDGSSWTQIGHCGRH